MAVDERQSGHSRSGAAGGKVQAVASGAVKSQVQQTPDERTAAPNSKDLISQWDQPLQNAADAQQSAPSPIAGLGASADGLQALKNALERLGQNSGIALVLLTAPEQERFLAEIVERAADSLPRRSRVQKHLVDAHDFACAVVEGVPAPIVVLNQDCTIRTVNMAFRALTQMEAVDLERRSLPELMNHLWGIDNICAKLEPLLQSPRANPIEFEHESTTAQHKTLLIRAQALCTEGGCVLLLMMEDITLRRDAERLIAKQTTALKGEVEIAVVKLNRSQEELRSLTAHLFSVQEEERQRVARELHDDISQRLSLLEMALQETRCTCCDEEDRRWLEAARQHAHALNIDVRQISHRLHPAVLSDLGLPAALKALVKDFGERENMPATYLSRNLPESWPPDTATAIYRIAQEALRNVAKHAGKTHVKVMLGGMGSKLQLRVMDFGVGFDRDQESPARGLGMISMQERARLAGGTLTVQSALGEGTTVMVEVPLERHA